VVCCRVTESPGEWSAPDPIRARSFALNHEVRFDAAGR
jgi:hypothetical protein